MVPFVFAATLFPADNLLVLVAGCSQERNARQIRVTHLEPSEPMRHTLIRPRPHPRPHCTPPCPRPAFASSDAAGSCSPAQVASMSAPAGPCSGIPARRERKRSASSACTWANAGPAHRSATAPCPKCWRRRTQLQDALRRRLSTGRGRQLQPQAGAKPVVHPHPAQLRWFTAVAASNWRAGHQQRGQTTFLPLCSAAGAGPRGAAALRHWRHHRGAGLLPRRRPFATNMVIRWGWWSSRFACRELDANGCKRLTSCCIRRHGVVFLASQDAWRYRLLQPLSDEERRELNATRQHAPAPAPLGNAGGRPHGQRWWPLRAWLPALICLRPRRCGKTK